MGDLLIHDMPDSMKSDIAARAERHGTSLSDEAKDLLGKAISSETPLSATSGLAVFDAIRSAFENEGALDEEFSAIMDEIEAERKKDFGRPFEDFE